MHLTESDLRALYDDKSEADRILRGNPPRDAPGIAHEPRHAAHERFTMNRTEARFAAVLDAWQAAGRIVGWAFERDTLVLTPDMKYTPDFAAVLPDGRMMFFDVKGKHVWEDSVVKGKAAAGFYPHHRFFLVKLVAGEWRFRRLGVKGRSVEDLEDAR